MSIAAIERAAEHSWPASERTTMGEWVLSASDGFSRRRNSAVPAGQVTDSLEERLDAVTAWYTERKLPTLYRVTPLCDPRIDTVLDQRGFSIEDPVLVMVRELPVDELSGRIVSLSVPTDGWAAIECEALGIDRTLFRPWLSAIRAVPQPACFVIAMDGSRPVGAGFGAISDGLLGVFEVAVLPDARLRGHARRMMSALHSFGNRGGAEQAYLQVVEENDAAVDLYRSIGYEVSHRYWYRRATVEGS